MKEKNYLSYRDGSEVESLYIRPEQVEFLDFYADLFGVSRSAVLDMVFEKAISDSHFDCKKGD